MLKDHNAVMLVRFEPAAPRSRVKHSTTEPLRSLWGKELEFVNNNYGISSDLRPQIQFYDDTLLEMFNIICNNKSDD